MSATKNLSWTVRTAWPFAHVGAQRLRVANGHACSFRQLVHSPGASACMYIVCDMLPLGACGTPGCSLSKQTRVLNSQVSDRNRKVCTVYEYAFRKSPLSRPPEVPPKEPPRMVRIPCGFFKGNQPINKSVGNLLSFPRQLSTKFSPQF